MSRPRGRRARALARNPVIAVSAVLLVALIASAACSTTKLTKSPGASQASGPSAPATGSPQASDAKVVGYYAGWTAQRGYPVKNIDTSGSAAKLTHINYAFGDVRNGKCVMADAYNDHDRLYAASESVDGRADSQAPDALRGNFNQLRKLKAKYPHLKVLWSFGGWTGSGGFSQAAADPKAFAESCYKLVENVRWSEVFDGIDIDWEYPNACGVTCDKSGPDAFGGMMSALRSRFGEDALVSAAITADASPRGKLDATGYARAARYVDWYLPMTYDYFGVAGTGGPTAPHSPLYSYNGIPEQGSSTDAAIRKLKSMGVPESKLLLGLGFYGRGWTGVTQSRPGGAVTGSAPGKYEVSLEDYKVLKTRCPPTGKVAGTAYAKCGDQWWSYDTPATISGKMTYVRKQGLRGAFFWDLSGDTPNGELITAIRKGIR